MSKTKEELNALKENLESLSAKLQELTPEELKQVTGGLAEGIEPGDIVGIGYQATGGAFIYRRSLAKNLK